MQSAVATGRGKNPDSLLLTEVGYQLFITPTEPVIDSQTLIAMRAHAIRHIGLGQLQLIIDLSQVQQPDSAALECLMDIRDHAELAGGWLKAVHASALVRDIIRISGVCELDETHNSESPDEPPLHTRSQQPLGEILLGLGAVTEERLTQAIRLQKREDKRMGQILLEQNWVSEKHLLKALSVQLGHPFISLQTGFYDPQITTLITTATARRLGMLPLFRLRKTLLLATADPQNITAFDEIEELTGFQVAPVLACQASIQQTLNELDDSRDNPALGTDLLSELAEDFEVVSNLQDQDFDVIDEQAEGSPIINLVNSIIQRAVKDGASDIHIEPGRNTARVRFRIDGILYQIMTPRVELIAPIVSRLKVMANLDIAERRLPQDGRIQVKTMGRPIDLRFSSLPGLYGEKLVLRVLDKNQSILDVNKLGMTDSNLQQYLSLLKHPYGLILVTGPTGSGKTTSLYAAINHLNSIEKNIVTIEDPVEYQVDIVNQNEVHDNIGLSFAKLLRHVLRQDPDVVLVGEIRDKETAEIAIQAALTGHLVLSTLHTNSAGGAIVRMIDMGVEPYLLASALVGVLAQRLIRTICPHCKTQYLAPKELCQQYHWPGDGSVLLTKGKGCSECYDSGFKSRIAIHELLLVNNELHRLIIQNPSLDALEAFRDRQGTGTLFDDGLDRVLRGLSSVAEINRVIHS
ncbi:MAG: ATPase, T2SS/T4P/T4SS family [Pontibacterium sp.]